MPPRRRIVRFLRYDPVREALGAAKQLGRDEGVWRRFRPLSVILEHDRHESVSGIVILENVPEV